jgi:hypothetical protein
VDPKENWSFSSSAEKGGLLKCGETVRTCPLSSSSCWSYSLRATQKMMDVTDSCSGKPTSQSRKGQGRQTSDRGIGGRTKQCIHFFRSLRCPPTSNMLKFDQHPSGPRTNGLLRGKTHWILSCPLRNLVSLIPVVFVRACKMSDSVGVYVGSPIRSTESKKL